MIRRSPWRSWSAPAAVEQPEAAQHGYPATIVCAAITAALGPAYVVRWHVGPLPTTLLEAAILVTLAAFAVESARASRWPAWRTPVTIPAAIFLVAGAISVVDAPSRVAALGVYRAYFVEPMLVALALTTALQTPRQAYLVVLGFGAGAMVVAAANSFVVLQAIVNHSLSAQLAPPSAIYPVGNMVALYLMPLVGLAAGLLVLAREPRIRFALAVCTALAAAAVVLSFSRGGWVALGAVAVAAAISAQRRRLWLGLLAAATLALAVLPPISQRIAADLRDPTLDGRTPIWSESLRMLVSHPILGAGLSGFMTRIQASDPSFHLTLNFPHDIVLNFWSETGLLGLVSFAAIFIVVATVSWRGFKRGPDGWRPLHLGVLFALLAILVHGLVDNPYFKNDLSFEFWVLVAFSTAGWSAGLTRGTSEAREPAMSRRT